MSQQAQKISTKRKRRWPWLTRAVNEEIKDLFGRPWRYRQFDEPYMQAQPEKARQFGVRR